MKRHGLYLFLLGLLGLLGKCTPATAQTGWFVQSGIGHYGYHADNGLAITADEEERASENYTTSLGFAVGYATLQRPGREMHVSLGYTYSAADLPGATVHYASSDSHEMKKVTLRQHFLPVDAGVIYRIEGPLWLGGGLTAGAVRRVLNAGSFRIDERTVLLKERVYGFGLGGHARAQLRLPLASHATFLLTLEARYFRSFLYADQGRDLSGYTLDFLSETLSAGFVWHLR